MTNLEKSWLEITGIFFYKYHYSPISAINLYNSQLIHSLQFEKVVFHKKPIKIILPLASQYHTDQ